MGFIIAGGGGGSAVSYTEVAVYADLPDAATVDGKIYIVKGTTGIWGFRKLAGFYKSAAGNWVYLGVGDWVDVGTDQTVGGIKTFSSSPVVPDATVVGQAVNRGQIVPLVISALPAHYQCDAKWQQGTTRTKLQPPTYLTVNINNNGYILSGATEIDINSAANWDSASPNYTVAANRAGKDFYIYACQPVSGSVPVLKLSANSTIPGGYTASNSRKIGGYHCLSLNVGTIAGHTLTGYLAGDILPASVWDLNHRPVSTPEGMVYDANTDRWVDIYLASVQSGKLASVYNAATADGASSPTAFHWYNGTDWMARVKKNLLTQRQFVSASLGSNQGTNIAGSADPNTIGAHNDTAGRRMISNIGCEDMCGALWQWGCEAGGTYGTAAYKNAFDGNDTGVGGQSYNEPSRALLGGCWDYGASCGSRASSWAGGPLFLAANCGLRGCADTGV